MKLPVPHGNFWAEDTKNRSVEKVEVFNQEIYIEAPNDVSDVFYNFLVSFWSLFDHFLVTFGHFILYSQVQPAHRTWILGVFGVFLF